jgi:alkanesulfonate monooxygenase SsuD/methylene tetrahydromethanopterin reductase-like flavin-dependent oxidoreductase (luciferase family)
VDWVGDFMSPVHPGEPSGLAKEARINPYFWYGSFAGTAQQLADRTEEMFEATGSRGGFMLSISQAAPRAVLSNTVDFLVPELKRRGRYRTSYEGKTLRENLLA